MKYGKGGGKKGGGKSKGAGSVKLHKSKNQHIKKPKISGYKSGRKTP